MGTEGHHLQQYWRGVYEKQFRAYVDFDMPQVYWEKDFRDEAGEVQLKSSYIQFQKMTLILPYLPTGLAYKVDDWKTTAKQVRRFILKAKDLGFPGLIFGYGSSLRGI